jgi:hypothetical protein
MQAKNYAAAIDAMGALSAQVKLHSGYAHCCAVFMCVLMLTADLVAPSGLQLV